MKLLKRLGTKLQILFSDFSKKKEDNIEPFFSFLLFCFGLSYFGPANQPVAPYFLKNKIYLWLNK